MNIDNLRVHEMNISKESIDYLLKVIKENNFKKVLEIGCFNGYSALKFSTVAESVKTIEMDKKAIEIAKENFKKYNAINIEVLEGKALEVLPKIKEKFDLILIDAMKNEYKDYLIYSLKLISKNGIIYADNTISHKNKMKSLFEYLENSKLKWKELNLGKGLIEN
jgi:caffeoyl-CoA O-methyltransferase